MKELRDLKDLTIHDVQPVSDESTQRTVPLAQTRFHQPSEGDLTTLFGTPDLYWRNPDPGGRVSHSSTNPDETKRPEKLNLVSL